jgi:hypothetical protein
MASNPSAAAMALGFPGSATSLYGGGSIADQMANETEEEKRRRLLAMQQSQQGQRPGGVGAGYGSVVSAAGSALGLT